MGSSIFSILSAVYLSPGAMARLCLLALFVLSTFFNNSSANTLKVKRDACEDKQEEVQNCQNSAYEEYKTAMAAGEDGRPDWMARKSCNYITATIEECTNQLVGDCATEEEVNDMKDGQLEGLLEQLSDTIKEWDSEKCPAIKAYMDRNAAEDEEETQEEVAASVDTAAQEKEEEEEEEEETDNGDPAGSSEEPEKDGGDEEDSEDPEKDGGDEEDPEDQVDAGSGDVNNDSADAEDSNGEEQSNEEGGEDKETGDESNEGPESGSETAVASLSLVLVMYKICSA